MADATPKETEETTENLIEESESVEPPSDVFNKGFVATETETMDESANEKVETDLESLPIYNLLRDFYKTFTEDGPNLLKMNDSKADEIWKCTAYTIQAAEALLRLDKKAILGQLPVRKDKAIEMAVRACVCQADLGIDRADECAANELGKGHIL